MIPFLPALYAGAHLAVAVAAADKVPNINVTPSCRVAASVGLGLQQTYDACLRSENEARDQLARQWSEFPRGDRTSCTSMATMGTEGTYTELLTCLEMKRDARKLRGADDKDSANAYGQARP